MGKKQVPVQEVTSAEPRRWISDRDWTPEQRSAFSDEKGAELRKDRPRLVAFLQSSGILNDQGELAEIYRTP